MSVSARPSVGNDSFSFDRFELRFKDIYPIDGYYLKVASLAFKETTITEGDTITNNYTIYYLIDGSGSVTPPCEHDWQEASGTDPTCTLPGKVTLSCAKCQQTKTETLPALGHDWQVKQTVTTQYDDTGQLIGVGIGLISRLLHL